MQTVYEFKLPRGYMDDNGALHRCGKMRLATARDEIESMRDPRVLNNPSYLSILLLSKVVIELGGVETINVKVIEQLFTADLAFLEDMYKKINVEEVNKIKVICPNCGHEHEVSIGFK